MKNTLILMLIISSSIMANESQNNHHGYLDQIQPVSVVDQLKMYVRTNQFAKENYNKIAKSSSYGMKIKYPHPENENETIHEWIVSFDVKNIPNYQVVKFNDLNRILQSLPFEIDPQQTTENIINFMVGKLNNIIKRGLEDYETINLIEYFSQKYLGLIAQNIPVNVNLTSMNSLLCYSVKLIKDEIETKVTDEIRPYLLNLNHSYPEAVNLDVFFKKYSQHHLLFDFLNSRFAFLYSSTLISKTHNDITENEKESEIGILLEIHQHQLNEVIRSFINKALQNSENKHTQIIHELDSMKSINDHSSKATSPSLCKKIALVELAKHQCVCLLLLYMPQFRDFMKENAKMFTNEKLSELNSTWQPILQLPSAFAQNLSVVYMKYQKHAHL